jgi:D-alanine-D-alanine ligase
LRLRLRRKCVVPMEESKKTPRKVAVLMGGVSSEREISKKSGAAVAGGLRAAGCAVVEVDIRDRSISAVPRDADVAFIALHGEFGEDGQVQRLLQEIGMPYTGSNPSASGAAFDKCASKRVFVREGIPTPRYEVLKAGQKRTLPLPVVIKPPCNGSTIGVHRVFNESQWEPGMADALRYGPDVLVEEYIAGRELTVGIVGDETLPIIEILAPDGWYDFDAKYKQGGSMHLVPASLNDATARTCREVSMKTFRALGCSGMSRVDFRMSNDGALYVLELNNIPGFTETSLVPDAARAAGIAFPDLCMRILNLARV